MITDELNDREKNIVNLINQLSEYANDETDTKDAIQGILDKIRENTNEDMKDYMEKPLPEVDLSKSLKSYDKVMEEFKQELAKKQEEIMNGVGKVNSGCSCHSTVQEKPKQIVFTRIREVKAPGKAHPEDAGIDFYVPDEKAWDEDFMQKVRKYSHNPAMPPDGSRGEFVTFNQPAETIGGEHLQPFISVEPNGHVAIPAGIKTILPTGLGIMLVNKSGIATKLKLDHSACLIDSGYRDEWVFCFFNHSTEPICIYPGMKITQGLVVPIIDVSIQEVLNCVYDDLGNKVNRGGGFGSSGV